MHLLSIAEVNNNYLIISTVHVSYRRCSPSDSPNRLLCRKSKGGSCDASRLKNISKEHTLDSTQYDQVVSICSVVKFRVDSSVVDGEDSASWCWQFGSDPYTPPGQIVKTVNRYLYNHDKFKKDSMQPQKFPICYLQIRKLWDGIFSSWFNVIVGISTPLPKERSVFQNRSTNAGVIPI